MIKRTLLVILVGLLLVTSLTSEANIVSAADYDHRFTEPPNVSNLPSGSARSPIRSGASGANDNWVFVTSKNNQPRTSGDTNPHQGTDLRAGAGTAVYPILPGKVVWLNTTLTSQLGTVILQHDVNGDGVYDAHYVRYTHIEPISGIKVGDEFNVNKTIGKVDIKRPNGYDPHLHIQAVSAATSYKTLKMYNYYRTVSDWNFGSHLDYISGDVISSSGNKMYVTAYATTTGPDGVYLAEKIELYYKIGSTGTWSKSSTNFNVLHASIYRWEIDLKAATGAATGNTIYFYLVATRAGSPTDPSFTGSYKVGFWPQHNRYNHMIVMSFPSIKKHN